MKHFLGKEEESDRGVKTTKSCLLESVTTRFSGIEDEPLYTVATMMDPR